MRKLLTVVALGLGTVGCGSSSPTAPTSSTPAPTPAPTATPTPAGPLTQFGSGQYRVGTAVGNVLPGRYYSDPATSCYWERQSGFGGQTSDIIANDFIGFNAGQWIVDILPSDAGFLTRPECGTWFTTPRRGSAANISPGMWLVGSQVAAGTYTANVGAGCYWERLRNFQNTVSASVIANDFVATAQTRIVTIGSGDAGFSTDGDCGTWTPSSAAAPAAAASSMSLAEMQRNWDLKHPGR